MHRRERHLTASNDAAAYCFPLKLSQICLQQAQREEEKITKKAVRKVNETLWEVVLCFSRELLFM